MKQICADLKAEYDVLDGIVSKLDNAGWATKTYCDDWTIQEEIAHVAFYDGTATLSATDPEAFAAHKKAMMSGDPEWLGKMELFISLIIQVREETHHFRLTSAAQHHHQTPQIL